MKASDIVESEILSLVRQSERICPVCLVIDKAVSGWLDGALSDLLHNEEARKKLAKGGLCRKHSEVFERVVRKNSNIGPLSAAIMLSVMLKSQLERIGTEEKPAKRKRLRGTFSRQAIGSCHLCQVALETEGRYLIGFSRFFGNNEVRKAYGSGATMICFDHTKGVMKRLEDNQQWFASIQKTKIKALLDDLELLVKRHDYRSAEPIGKEISSWKRALEVVGQMSSD